MNLRRLFLGLATAALVLVVLLVGNQIRRPSRQIDPGPPVPVDVDTDALARILSEVVSVPTISHGPDQIDRAALDEVHAILESRFPRVHATLERRRIAGHSVLYRWGGSDPSLAPALLMAHLDVVPAADADAWTHPPFSGRIVDGGVHGRGTLDDKQNVVLQLAAIEQLLRTGMVPRRTLYLAYGHDEEVGGTGAAAIAATLAAEGIRLAFVLDEGGAVMDGALKGLSGPVALVGIGEKGYASVEIVARSTGGHSSMPPPSTAAGRLAAAVVALEDSPLDARLQGPTAQMLDHLGPEMDQPLRLLVSNRWLFAPILTRVLAGTPKTNATVRTTTAVTMLEGSVKDNVLPAAARAVVNFRIAPGDTAATVLDHVRRVVGPGLEVQFLPGGIHSDPSPVSEVDAPAYRALARAARQTWPDVVVAPFLVLGATDARHFGDLSSGVYRFSPMRLAPDDLDGIHGHDEHITAANLANGCAFYVRLIRGATGADAW